MYIDNVKEDILQIVTDDDLISESIKKSFINGLASVDIDHALLDSVNIVVFNLFNNDWLVENFNGFFENKSNVIFFGYDLNSIWICRSDKSSNSACMFCLRSWLKNNLRDSPGSWFSIEKDSCPRPRLNSYLKFSPVANLATSLIFNEVNKLKILRENGRSVSNQVKRFDINKQLLKNHVFIAFPNCKHCNALPSDSSATAQFQFISRMKKFAADQREHNPKLNLEDLKSLFLDRWVGLIKHQFYSINTDLVPMYATESPVIGALETEMGYGRTDTLYQSRLISILEILERFASQRPRGVADLVRDCYSNLSELAVDPKNFILHNVNQENEPNFNLRSYSEELVFNWKWGFSVKENKPKLVPEQMIYYWLVEENNNQVNRFVYETSNGTSLGASLEEASLFAILEVVERDAYMTTWYGKFSPKQIDLSTISDSRCLSIIKRSELEGLKIHLFDIRIDIDIPVVWAMAIDPRSDAPIKSYCASSAHFNPEEAIWGALVEVITSISIYQKTALEWREEAKKMYKDPFMVKVMHDHVVLHSLPETIDRFDFLFSDKNLYSVADLYFDVFKRERNLDLTEELKFVMSQVLAVSEDLILVDISFPSLEKMNLNCVKVLAPGLHTITFGHQYRRISLARINKAARKLGYLEFDNISQINQFPHNFP